MTQNGKYTARDLALISLYNAFIVPGTPEFEKTIDAAIALQYKPSLENHVMYHKAIKAFYVQTSISGDEFGGIDPKRYTPEKIYAVSPNDMLVSYNNLISATPAK